MNNLILVAKLILLLFFTALFAIDFNKMQSIISEKYGADGLKRLKAWEVLMSNLEQEQADTEIKVNRINEFFNRLNRSIKFSTLYSKDIPGEPLVISNNNNINSSSYLRLLEVKIFSKS